MQSDSPTPASPSLTQEEFDDTLVFIPKAKIQHREWHCYTKAPKSSWRTARSASGSQKPILPRVAKVPRTRNKMNLQKRTAAPTAVANVQLFARGPSEDSIGFDTKYRKHHLRLEKHLVDLKYFFPNMVIGQNNKDSLDLNAPVLKEIRSNLAQSLKELASRPTPDGTPENTPLPKCLITEDELSVELQKLETPDSSMYSSEEPVFTYDDAASDTSMDMSSRSSSPHSTPSSSRTNSPLPLNECVNASETESETDTDSNSSSSDTDSANENEEEQQAGISTTFKRVQVARRKKTRKSKQSKHTLPHKAVILSSDKTVSFSDPLSVTLAAPAAQSTLAESSLSSAPSSRYLVPLMIALVTLCAGLGIGSLLDGDNMLMVVCSIACSLCSSVFAFKQQAPTYEKQDHKCCLSEEVITKSSKKGKSFKKGSKKFLRNKRKNQRRRIAGSRLASAN